MRFREVLQFCTEISFGWIVEIKWAPFRLQMEVILKTVGYFWELWGVLFWRLFLFVHFGGPRESGGAERSDLLGAGARQERP